MATTMTFKMSTGDTLRIDKVSDSEVERILQWFRSSARQEVIVFPGSQPGMTHNVQKAHVVDLITAD